MATPASTSTTKFYTRAEVATHKENRETWMIIHHNVYDVTGFLDEHPGGEEVLLDQAGKDSTEAFEDVGHSSDARQMMEPYKIGELVHEERNISTKDQTKIKGWNNGNEDEDGSSGSWRSWLIPVALGVLATVIYRYFTAAR
ncbi:hypothetical protein PV327_005722 [Microctonus hyperodae]|uniref:Cytochrome b5 n=1 Tax=Microctonus hyperodae TaxID=165561 RepID=A0AA39L000_MICHY|nr:hypothetical protein PV327_005722 [Microctonus hyperodae]